MLKPSLVLGAVLAATACGGSKPTPAAPVAATPTPEVEPPPEEAEPPPTPLPPIPATPAKAPLELIATASAPAPASLVPLLAAYVERIAPGSGAEVTLDALVDAAAEASLDLHGVDLARPVRVLLLDPVRFREPLVMVVTVSDETVFAAQVKERGFRYQVHGGLAAVGAEKTLIEAAPYALTTLASSPLPPAPTLDVDVGYLMLHYGAVLEGFIDSAAGSEPPERRELVRGMLNAMAALLGQVDHAQVAAEIVGERATGTLRLQARAGTALAAFLAAQTPSTFEQLGVLPGGPIAFAGRVDFDPLTDAFSELMEPMMGRFYGTSAPSMIDFIRRWKTIDLGELGATAQLTGGTISMSMLLDVSDPAAVVRLWNEAAAAQVKASGGVVKVTSKAINHKGTKLLSLVSTLGKDATDADRQGFAMWGTSLGQVLGVVGKTAVMTMGADTLPSARALVDRIKGGARRARPVDAGLRTVVDEAVRRRESVFMAMDLPTIVALAAARAGAAPPAVTSGTEPIAIGFGFGDGAATLRLTIPAPQIATMTTTMTAAEVSETDATLDRFDELADRACACKDQPCLDKVMTELGEMKEPAAKPTKVQMNRAMATAERMAACQKQILGIP